MFKFLPFALAIITVSSTASAQGTFDRPDAEFLIRACQAVTQVYNSHDEKRFLASQRTSLSDAMRAGYCLGVLEQYQCPSYRGKHSLFESARRIAILDHKTPENRHTSVHQLLQQSACR